MGPFENIFLKGLQGGFKMKYESKPIGEHVKTSFIVCAYFSIDTVVEISQSKKNCVGRWA